MSADQEKPGTPEGPRERDENPTEAGPELQPGTEEVDGAKEQKGPSQDPTTVEDRLARLEEEKKALEDKYLRNVAEFDNYRKRVSRDQNEYSKYATEKLLKELLVVVDNLERALHHGESVPELKGWLEGVELTFKQFLEILGKFGVSGFESVGKPFDPSRQQAMAQVESDSHEDNRVVEELQKGYMLHERVLRPALVTVSKRKENSKEGEASSS